MAEKSFLLRARVVVPVTQPPIHDGAVFVSGDRIRDVGPWEELSTRHPGVDVTDLSDQIVLPGLINAHCHLDYTRMAGGIPPKKSFSEWIKAILAYKADWSYTDFAESWVAGANMLLRYGTTTVLDVESVPELLEEAWGSTPLRVISAMEMTGIRSGKSSGQILNDTMASIPERGGAPPQIALSPHSLYSTKPDLVRLAAEAANERNWLLTTHVSESTEEMEMFIHQRGPMHDWLRTQRDMSDCDGRSPVEILDQLGALSDRFIAVHGNCLSHGDIDRLARHRCSVAHCPRSHDYFRHPKFPLEQLRQAGVNVCLGTDSLASVRGTNRSTVELNLFKEMRALAKSHPELPAEQIVQFATSNGARALRRTGELGELTPGAMADLIAIPAAGDCADPCQMIVDNCHPVSCVLINGRAVHPV